LGTVKGIFAIDTVRIYDDHFCVYVTCINRFRIEVFMLFQLEVINTHRWIFSLWVIYRFDGLCKVCLSPLRVYIYIYIYICIGRLKCFYIKGIFLFLNEINIVMYSGFNNVELMKKFKNIPYLIWIPLHEI